jgi:hypothetical protein
VHGAGELPDIADIAARLDASGLGLAGRAPPDNWRNESRAHIARLRLLAPNTLRVTDKAPGNFLHLGLIAALFPRARVVHCMRSAVDTGLSCYAHNLGDHWNWACDLEWVAHYTHQYRRLMGHWRTVLPIPVLEFSYEELVGDFDFRARKLVDFCGLDWAPECADFHRTARPVHTASQQQVRQPLYAGSVEKWRRYERHLEPLIKALDSAS